MSRKPKITGRYYFCAPMRLYDGHLAFEIECDIECSVDDDEGTADPFLWVHDIYIDGRRLDRPSLYSPGMWSQISSEIRRLAEADTDLFATVAEAEGWEYRGLGGNDPDGCWRRSKHYGRAA